MLDTSTQDSDALTQVLLSLRLDCVEYDRRTLRAPWAMAFPAQANAQFYFAAHGDCWLKVGDSAWLEVKQGDAVLLPRGTSHIIASSADVQTADIPAHLQLSVSELSHPAGGPAGESESTHMLFCARFRFNLDAGHPLLAMMADVLRVGEIARRDPNVPMLLEAMEREITSERVGACGIAARIADVLAATTIRAWAECASSETFGLIAALRSPVAGKALAAIHADLAREWTVEGLAKVSGSSRTALNDAFRDAVGETPVRYIARLRMFQASEWISVRGMRVSVAADRLGYESEASFSRAYKRIMGRPPSAARAQRQQERS